MKRFLTTLLASLSLFAGTASALSISDPFICVPKDSRNVGLVYGYILWGLIDTDRDCHISLDELQAWQRKNELQTGRSEVFVLQNKYLMSNFDAIDTNKDGKLTMAEIVNASFERFANYIKAFDNRRRSSIPPMRDPFEIP